MFKEHNLDLGDVMNKGAFLTGIVLIAVGGILIGLSAMPKNVEVTNPEDLGHKGYSFGVTGRYQEWEAKYYLVPGIYELHYDISGGGETATSLYLYIIDPDGFAIKSEHGPDTTLWSDKLIFETQKTGEHSFKISGQFWGCDLNLYKLTKEVKTVYPYEVSLYIGLLLVIGGAVASIAAALKKQTVISSPQH